MKPWMKILMWLGLGGGIGFFAGYKVGCCSGDKPACRGSRMRPEQMDESEVMVTHEKALEAMRSYQGDTDGDHVVVVKGFREEPEGDDGLPEGWENDPMTIPPVENVDGDPNDIPMTEVPQLHLENTLPVPISEEEFDLNEPEYVIKCLDFYEEDEVLYDPEREDILAPSEEYLGYGWTAGFHGDPNSPTEVLYIQNDTMGTLYRVELVHAAFQQEVPGTIAPEEDDEEDDM